MSRFAPTITEHVKWNAPAWQYHGPLPADANPKTYPRDVLVLNLRQKNGLLLIFPTGARIAAQHPVLQGDYADGRRMVLISPATDLNALQTQLTAVVSGWLQTVC